MAKLIDPKLLHNKINAIGILIGECQDPIYGNSPVNKAINRMVDHCWEELRTMDLTMVKDIISKLSQSGKLAWDNYFRIQFKE